MNEKQRIAVAIVVHQQKVLVGKRASNAKTAQGFHEFPGGKIEKGEIASTAAIRECFEETGLHISIERQINKSFTDEECLEIIFFLGGSVLVVGFSLPSSSSPGSSLVSSSKSSSKSSYYGSYSYSTGFVFYFFGENLGLYDCWLSSFYFLGVGCFLSFPPSSSS